LQRVKEPSAAHRGVAKFALRTFVHVSYPNRVLREAGLLSVRKEEGSEHPDFSAQQLAGLLLVALRTGASAQTANSEARGGIHFNGSAANGSKCEIKTGRDNNPVV